MVVGGRGGWEDGQGGRGKKGRQGVREGGREGATPCIENGAARVCELT